MSILVPPENFETDGEGVRYTSNSADAAYTGDDFFERHDFSTNPHPEHQDPVSNLDGDWAWASEDPDVAALGAGVLRLNDLDVSGFNMRQITIGFAVGNDFEFAWEANDLVLVEYALDGDSGGTDLSAGSYTLVGRLLGNNTLGGHLQQDTNLDGTADGAIILTRMQDFTFDIPDTGNTLSVQVRVESDASEEFVFDNLRVTGEIVPETSGIALVLFGFGSVLWAGRRRRV